jgi:3-oxoacyl-[acyl-carrier-protein] synthase-3
MEVLTARYGNAGNLLPPTMETVTMGAEISTISYHLPAQMLTNQDLCQEFPNMTPDKIFSLSGVRNRYIASADETPSDLAYSAAEKLFSRHPETREEIDVILYCTQEPDAIAPITSCVLHERLHLRSDAFSLDIPNGCTGFVNGLLVAKSLLTNPNFNKILLLTAETGSKMLHPKDLKMRVLFSDAGCATLVSQTDSNKIGEFVTGTDGGETKGIWAERSGIRNPVDIEWLSQFTDVPNGMRNGRALMNGEELLYFCLTRVPKLFTDTLETNGLHIEDIDLFIFHQASKIVLDTLKKKCKIPDDKFLYTLEEYGNSGAATIPLALYVAIKDQRVLPGQKVMLVSFGVGLAWNATIIDLPEVPHATDLLATA